MLKTRIKTIVILNIVIIPLVCLSYKPYLMNIATSVLSIGAIYELYSALSKPLNYYMFIISSAAAVAVSYFDIPYLAHIITAALCVAVPVFLVLMLRLGKYSLSNTPTAFAFSLLIPLLYRSIPEIRAMEYGVFLVFMLIIQSILNEMGGYFIGRKLGKHKLCPTVSPNKTIEGALGGAAVAMLLLNIIGFICAKIAGFSINVPLFEIYLFAGSLIGQYSDLCASVIKRSCGIKDYGEVFPGHGGVLDRFDSQLFSAPFTLAVITLAGPILR